MQDGTLLLTALGVSLALNMLLIWLLASAERRMTRLRARRQAADSPAARIAERANQAEARQDARPLAGTVFLKTAPAPAPAASGNSVLLAKKPSARSAPVLPKDIALDYQAGRDQG